MSFNILYIEDNPKDWMKLENAIDSYNKATPPEHIHLEWAENPEELKKKLSHRIDIILADMFFFDSVYAGEVNRLIEIINIAKEWENENSAGRPFPIIAYTISGEEALNSCKEAEKELYDIWDKNTASPEYVTWRLSKLSIELSRIRPDALIQTLIRTEIDRQQSVPWHKYVLDMIKRYDEGLTEKDQIKRAGQSISDIAVKLNVWDSCEPMWQVVIDWEFLGRAVSRRARGHARHAINVFWLGYYLLHKDPIKDIFISSWEEIKKIRPEMQHVTSDTPFEAIHNIWFYTGLFHDMAGCLEKYNDINNFHQKIYSTFENLELDIPDIPYFETKEIKEHGNKLIGDEFNGQLETQLRLAWNKKLSEKKADHGMLAALHLRKEFSCGTQFRYTREAARAICIHNLIGEFKKKKIDNLTWEKEPFACLLLLCDQLQTWDRERGDRKLSIRDEPERAELSALNVELKGEKPHITISIDYIAPSHLDLIPIIFEDVKEDLKYVLRDKPGRALKKIAGKWPFSLHVEFSLNKMPLNAPINKD